MAEGVEFGPSLSKQRKEFPWAWDAAEKGRYTLDDRVRNVVEKLTIRTTFGLGGLPGVVKEVDKTTKETQDARAIIGRAISLDCSLFLNDVVRDLVKAVGTPTEHERWPASALPYQKMDTAQQAKFRDLRDHFKTAGLSSILAQLGTPVSFIEQGIDLTTIFADPVVRQLLWVKDEASVTALTSPPQRVVDRWFHKGIPGTLFSLRFLDTRSHRIAHATVSTTRLVNLLPRFLPRIPSGKTDAKDAEDQGIYLHIANIDRGCLLNDAQVKRLINIPDPETSELLTLCSPNQLFMSQAVIACALGPKGRNAITPSRDDEPSQQEKDEWQVIREGFKERYIETSRNYEQALVEVAMVLFKERETVRKSRASRVDDMERKKGTPEATSLSTADLELYEKEKGDKRTPLERFSDILDEVATFIKETGAYTNEIARDCSGSRLNLLAAVEKNIQRGNAGASYIDYLEKVWDVLSWCNHEGMFTERFSNPEGCQSLVLGVLTTISRMDHFLARPLSEIYAAIETALGTHWRPLGRKASAWIGSVRNITFPLLLELVGGIQEFTGDYFKTGMWPSFPPESGFSIEICLWRFYLEIEYLLDFYMGTGKNPTDITKRSLITYIPPRIQKFTQEGWFDVPPADLLAITKEIPDFSNLLATARAKKGKLENIDEIILAIGDGNWVTIMSLLFDHAKNLEKNEEAKVATGDANGEETR